MPTKYFRQKQNRLWFVDRVASNTVKWGESTKALISTRTRAELTRCPALQVLRLVLLVGPG